jgi:hypothetical protein
MRRTVSEVQVGDRSTRYKLRVEDDAVAGDIGWRLIKFMEALTLSPDLLNCGWSKPQKLVFYHSGLFWVAEGEATVEDRDLL